MITGDHVFAIVCLLLFAAIEAWAWRASRRAQAEQDERDAQYILGRLMAPPPNPWRHDPDHQAHALVRQVLDGIPGFDEYFNRQRKPFDPRAGKSKRERGHYE